MPTQLFLRNLLLDDLVITGSALMMSQRRGAASVTATTTTVASGTNIVVTTVAGGANIAWFTLPFPEAVTISGTVTVNIRGRESANAVNAGRGILIERTDVNGGVLGTILADTTVPGTIAEYSTTDAANAAFSPAITSTNMQAGDRIKVTLKVRNVGTMGAGTVINTYNGPTAAAAGDTFVTFSSDWRNADPIEVSVYPIGRSGYYGG